MLGAGGRDGWRFVCAVAGAIAGGAVGFVAFIYSALFGLIGNAPDIEGLHHVLLAMFAFPLLGAVLGAMGGLAAERYDRGQ